MEEKYKYIISEIIIENDKIYISKSDNENHNHLVKSNAVRSTVALEEEICNIIKYNVNEIDVTEFAMLMNKNNTEEIIETIRNNKVIREIKEYTSKNKEFIFNIHSDENNNSYATLKIVKDSILDREIELPDCVTGIGTLCFTLARGKLKLKAKCIKGSLRKAFTSSKLEEVDLSEVNMQEVNDLSFVFEDCEELKKVTLSKISTVSIDSINSIHGMINNCKSLSDIDISCIEIKDSRIIDTYINSIRRQRGNLAVHGSVLEDKKYNDIIKVTLRRNNVSESIIDKLDFIDEKIIIIDSFDGIENTANRILALSQTSKIIAIKYISE